MAYIFFSPPFQTGHFSSYPSLSVSAYLLTLTMLSHSRCPHYIFLLSRCAILFMGAICSWGNCHPKVARPACVVPQANTNITQLHGKITYARARCGVSIIVGVFIMCIVRKLFNFKINVSKQKSAPCTSITATVQCGMARWWIYHSAKVFSCFSFFALLTIFHEFCVV